MDPNDFEGGLGKKRRHDDEPAAGTGDDEDDGSENEHQTSKSRGTVTVQIFIKKTYTMINDCDPKIAGWTPEGDKFVIKDPDMFAQKVIPQYFDHNKFSSFTRQLNFYKFTREQSKAIKKSDNSSEIAKHQTFYHKYFQRGRPDLLKHLQRSRKTHAHDDDPGHSSKKPKTVSSSNFQGEQSVLEQVSELTRRVNESEMTIKNLQQENSTLSFSMQKLQQQDEMKQRALVALEEHVRVMEMQMTQAIQQQQAQLRNISQPLPFDRESSYSAVNPSTLMRYLSMNNGLQRLTTPPFGQLTASGAGGFGAAQTAENLVANEKNNRSLSPTLLRHPRMKGAGGLAGGGTSPTNGGQQATLSRHPRMKGNMGGGGNSPTTSGPGPDLPQHMKMKEGGVHETAAAVAASMDAALEAANGGNAPTLRRHPRMKGAGEIQAGSGQQQSNGGNMMNRVTFQDNIAMAGLGDAKQEGAKGQGMGNENRAGAGRISPSPPGPNIIAQNGFSGSAQLGASFSAAGRSGGSPKPGGASQLERELSATGSLGGINLGAAGLGSAGLGLGAGGLGGLGGLGAAGLAGLGGLGASGLGSAGLGASGLGSAGLGATGLGAAGLGAAGLGGGSGLGAANLAAATGLQEREISNIGTEVTREESFSIASLLDLARSSQQPI